MPAAPLLTTLSTGQVALLTDTILSVLGTDPALLSVNLKVVSYRDGYDENQTDKPEPDEPELPYLRLRLAGSSLKWENEHQHHQITTYDFALFTLGPHENDLTNLAQAVLQAFFPQEPTRREFVLKSFREGVPGLTGGHFGREGAVSTIGKAKHGLTMTIRVEVDLSINT